MYNINIGDNTLIAIITIVLAIIIMVMYYTKRKYDSLNLYNLLMLLFGEYHTYKENQKQYKRNSKDFDILADDENELIENIISIVNKIRGSG